MAVILSMYVVVCLTLLPICTVATSAFAMTWSQYSFGPDGPWQAVQVSIGSPGQTIALYPGGTFGSHIFTQSICQNKSLGPLCAGSYGYAGTFDTTKSSTLLDNIVQFPASADISGGALNIQGQAGMIALDQMDISGGQFIIPNVSLALNSNSYLTYPDGSAYPLSVGTLGLGGAGAVNQTFTENFPIPSINASLVPGYMASSEVNPKYQTPSNSFGLHIGSVSPAISGSLYLGGYDQNRVIGDISTQLKGDSPIEMLDIGINVIEGASPWNTSSVSGLLAAGNSSIGISLEVSILPEAPYLDLPKSTCDSIAAWLPVTYQPKYGLYFWNTNDPQYEKIVSSPSALSFTFRKDQSNTMNLTINVPFLLLNLTLTSPLIGTPTQYFPCNAESQGSYSLGRAFLQAAFFATNWNTYNEDGLWWLAQAPGPNISKQSNVNLIGASDATITASTNDWKTSWDNSWKALPAPTTSSPTPPASATGSPSGTPSSTSIASSPSSGLSTGAQAGIGVGCALIGIGVLGAGIFIFRNLQRRKARYSVAQPENGQTLPGNNAGEGPKYMYAGFADGTGSPQEIGGTPVERRFPQELPS